MTNKICIIIGLTAGVLWMSHTVKASSKDAKAQEMLQRHIDIVKTTNPQMYQSMLDAAGGNIVNCLSCHKDIFQDKGPSIKRPLK